MTLDPTSYVPVLKVKRGEKSALGAVAPSLRPRITPLLEIVERTQTEIDSHLNTAFKGLSENLTGYPRCFLDTHEIEGDGPATAAAVFRRATEAGISFTPVTGVTRTVDVAAALQYGSSGVAVRLTRGEFESGVLPQAIPAFLQKSGLKPEEIDLIIDLGPVNDFVAQGVIGLSNAFVAEVPYHTKWRTFIISGCAFPPGMGQVPRNSHAYVDRAEWIAWRDNFRANPNRIPRVPTFSDCAIQHPIGVEGFNPIIMQPSASIRYTLLECWLLIKGEGTKSSPARDQFRGLATQLVSGVHRNSYMGRNHCPGCELIDGAANGYPRLGSPEVWRRIGTIHHISTAIRQL